MTSDAGATRRELIEELDSLSATLERAWRDVAPGEDPRIPVLSDVVETGVATPADVPAVLPDDAPPAAAQPPAAQPATSDAVTALVDDLVAEWLPVLAAELRARLLERALAGRGGTAPPDRAQR